MPERERSATPSAFAALRGSCRSPRRSYPHGRARCRAPRRIRGEVFRPSTCPGGVSGRAPEEAPWKDGDRDGRRPLTVRQQIHGEPVNWPPPLAPSPLIAERPPRFIQDPPSSQANAVTDGRHSADAHLVRSAPNADSVLGSADGIEGPSTCRTTRSGAACTPLSPATLRSRRSLPGRPLCGPRYEGKPRPRLSS